MKSLVFIFFLVCFSAFGQEQDLFEEANKAYAEENYTEAVEKYEQIIENGKVSPELYFNLGNAYYKLEQVAPSIFYFEKARQLAPNDKDILNNLSIAETLRIDDFQNSENQYSENIFYSLGFNSWAWVAICFAVLFAIFFALYYFSTSSKAKRIYFTSAAIGLLMAFFAVGAGYFQLSQIQNRDFAIIFAEELEVKNEPNQKAENIFILHAGSKVEIIERFKDWAKIELPDEKQGWVVLEQLKSL